MELPKIVSKHSEDTIWIRSIVAAEAAPGVTWQEILEEFYTKKHDKDAILLTATFVHHIYLLSLPIKTFIQMSNQAYDGGVEPPEEDLYEMIARELIAQRDYAEAGGHLGPKIDGKSPTKRNFWPK